MSRTNNSSFYKNNKWTVKRAKILKRDGYECQNCRRYFRSKEAKVVHHIYFYEDYRAPLKTYEKRYNRLKIN